MKSEACRNCIGSAVTAPEVLAVLNDPPERCKTCAHSSVMRVAAEQFQMRLPHWWVVNGNVVIPIWAVELLKTHVTFET